MIEPVLKLNKV